jgi:hyperosmotically inducible periplasmic protein
MNMKPALLVAALAAAAVVTVGCEQRGGSDTVGKRDTSSGSMQAQNTPGGGTNTAPGGMSPTTPGGPSSDKMAQTSPAPDKSMGQPNAAADKIGGAADDAAITAKVKAAILAEPGLKSLSINVDTKGATVTLSGNVASDNLRDRAKQIAMSTEGVKNVVDNLTVKAG